MPGLSGSQAAYLSAIADVARADTTRAAAFPRNRIPVWINGASRTGLITATLSIDLHTGSDPHTCQFDFKGGSGFVPLAGQSVVIGHGTTDNPLFSGRLVRAERSGTRADERRPVYRCSAVGHVFDLGASRVATGIDLSSLTPRAIVSAMFSVTTPSVVSAGFDASYIAGDLRLVDRFTMGPSDSIPEALAGLFERVGATLLVDHKKRVRAFTSQDPSRVSPETLTASVPFKAFTYAQTDLSRAYSRVQVMGGGTHTLADVDLSTQASLPVGSVEFLFEGDNGVTFPMVSDGVLPALVSDVPTLLGGLHRNTGNAMPFLESGFPAGRASVFLPASRGANSLIVVGANTNSFRPLAPRQWYSLGGQHVYVSSLIGVYSATASSIAYAYWLPGPARDSNVPGALTTDVSAFADIGAVWNKENALTYYGSPTVILPAGAQVVNFLEMVNSPAAAILGSLTGGDGLINHTVSDSNLHAYEMAAAASMALTRGAPGQWASVEFTTRSRAYDIGRVFYMNVPSLAEPSAPSMVGSFTVHDVHIGGFDALTDTQGPEFTISGGAVKAPTLWTTLINLDSLRPVVGRGQESQMWHTF